MSNVVNLALKVTEIC